MKTAQSSLHYPVFTVQLSQVRQRTMECAVFLLASAVVAVVSAQPECIISPTQWSFRKLTTMGMPKLSAEGAKFEALSAVGSGEGCPLPSRLGGLAERRKLPQRGEGQENIFLDRKMHFKKYICILSIA